MSFARRLLPVAFAFFFACQSTPPRQQETANNETPPFLWENATVYFLLTDRFSNSNPNNDVNFGRTQPSAPLRGFMGGDIAGITQKLSENYFSDLGVTAIWFTPVVEQIHGQVDEGFGANYGFHGYWARDWTAIDPNFGTASELAELVKSAHEKGIRVVLDVVLNHTGPVTDADPVWPADWVRTGPRCEYTSYETTTSCTLVANLPDVLTGSNEEVELPAELVAKWKAEGRYEQEIRELDDFFNRTGYPRAPRYYIIKWLTDYVREFGVDGFRVDTAKHLEESVWGELYKEAKVALAEWKAANPTSVLDDNDFYMVGEVYGYGISGGRLYDFGDKKVDYFDQGFHSLINFEFKYDARSDYEAMFSKYSNALNGALSGFGTLNYLSSHDDGDPFDAAREKSIEAGTRLLLSPGAAQIYYGDETGRRLQHPEATGDAVLRTFMNWEELATNADINGVGAQTILRHWQKLGVFKREHPAVGAGMHQALSQTPYVFARTYQSESYSDKVVVGLSLPIGQKQITVDGIFENGDRLKEYYSEQEITVAGGVVSFSSPHSISLLARPVGEKNSP